MLHLMAIFAINDPEPLLDRLADCSAILWTLVLWMTLAASLSWLTALVLNAAALLHFSEQAAKVAMIIITALAFLRWLFKWTTLLGNPHVVPAALVTLSIALGLWVWRRRTSRRDRDLDLPSLRDFWGYFGLPVLTSTMALLVFIAGSHWLMLKYNRAILRESIAEDSFEGAGDKRPNVVLIVADALRAQNMSLYGHTRKTTPFLDGFADSSNVYSQMYSNSTSTRPSLTSILSGRHPLSHGRLTKFLPAYDKRENLVALLRDNGYTTAAVASNADATFYLLGLSHELVHGEYPNFRRLTLSWLRDYGVYPTSPGNRMYDELAQFLPFLGYPERTLGYGPAEDSLALAARLAAKLPEPFFIFIHVHEPHNPYKAPAPFRGKYAKLDHGEVNNEIASNHYGRYQADLQPFVDAHRDHYDEAIEYLDSELAKFVDVLRENPKTDNVLLIITADHGESFERGFLNPGEDLYESSVHVPLIIKFPRQKAGQRSSAPVQSIDIAPTVLQSVGIAVPSWVDGVSLAGREGVEARELVIINYKDPEQRKVYYFPTKVAIRREQFKLIVSCDRNRAELYDLSRNPTERADLSASEVRVVKELWRNLEQYLARQKSEQRMECPFQPGR
jgi:arylsulfatase A-like enzyme